MKASKLSPVCIWQGVTKLSQEILSMQQIREIIERSICSPPEVYEMFLARIDAGKPTRDEERASHFCVYFLPYNLDSKKVFMVHHKKSGLWISPGGHIDQGETPLTTLAREMKEELGVTYKASANSRPLLDGALGAYWWLLLGGWRSLKRLLYSLLFVPLRS